MRRQATATLLTAGLVLSGCGFLGDTGGGGTADGPDEPTPPGTTVADRARLVKVERDRKAIGPDVALGTFVRGVLRVNEAGCYAVGDDVLVAPPGSLALGDGLGVHLPSLGDLRTGDRVEGVAGPVEDPRTLSRYDDCLDAGTTGVMVIST